MITLGEERGLEMKFINFASLKQSNYREQNRLGLGATQAQCLQVYSYCNCNQSHTPCPRIPTPTFLIFNEGHGAEVSWTPKVCSSTVRLERKKFVSANSLQSLYPPTYSVNKAMVWFFESVKRRGVQIQSQCSTPTQMVL